MTDTPTDANTVFGKQTVTILNAQPLSDGTLLLTFAAHGHVIVQHLKIKTLNFEYDPKLPPSGTYGWNIDAITQIHTDFKSLNIRVMHNLDYAAFQTTQEANLLSIFEKTPQTPTFEDQFLALFSEDITTDEGLARIREMLSTYPNIKGSTL